MINDVLNHIDDHLPDSLERLKALIRIPSISTVPDHAPDCVRAADWLVDDLDTLGFTAARMESDGHPVVVAHGSDEPAELLFYGHYDVQPIDPIDLWDSDPFDPQLVEQPHGMVITGRGACDDKGQLMTFIEACRAWREVSGTVPRRITMLLEGEEECGSPSLTRFLERHRDRLGAELAVICDTGLFDSRVPSIVTTLRGLVAEEVTVRGADMDLHSGMFGGIAANPLRALAAALTTLHDDTGRITIDGFYDGVADLSPERRAQWASLGFDAGAFLRRIGLSRPAGERGRDALEMTWSRPTCEINGMIGGYNGEGFKTVLPASASAKVSFRLVGEQDPSRIREAFRSQIRANLPPDCKADFTSYAASAASRMATSHPTFGRARTALGAEWDHQAVETGCGGSIPVTGFLQTVLGIDSLLVGFAKDDDRMHSPNEKYDLECYRRGIRSWARIIAPDN